MRFDQIFLGILLVALFSIGMTMMISDVNTMYGDDINVTDPGILNMTTTIDEMFNITEQSKESTLDTDIEAEDESWESMTKGSYSAVRLVKGSFSLINNIIHSAAMVLNIPPQFIFIAWLMFIIMIVFSVVYMIFRFIPK